MMQEIWGIIMNPSLWFSKRLLVLGNKYIQEVHDKEVTALGPESVRTD